MERYQIYGIAILALALEFAKGQSGTWEAMDVILVVASLMFVAGDVLYASFFEKKKKQK